MGTLNKMQRCSWVDGSPENANPRFDLAEINDLKTATSELLSDMEITIANNEVPLKELNSTCAVTDIFKDQNFNERLLVIKKAIALLEKSLSDH